MCKRIRFFAAALAVVAVVCLALALDAGAQTVTGTLSGHVQDKTGAVMPGVKVIIKSEQTGAVREVTTNEEGYYYAPFLNIGTYQVTVSVEGFNTIDKKGVVLELNKNTVSDFVLEVGKVATTLLVTGETPLIETTVGELKHSIDAKSIENTPLVGRNFMSLVEQIPGFQNAPWIDSSNNPTNSTGSYASFSGQGSRAATFQIDGVNNDDSSENQNRQNVNISTIKEFQVLTNAYSAEFGRAGGAVVLVQTKSGTNRFHGDVFDFIQNDMFNANGFFQNAAGNNPTTGQPRSPKQKIRRHQYGGTIGGPIFESKLFFFGSAERVSNLLYGTMTRFIWLPTDGPRACNAGEVPTPGGPYCVDPATHPNLARDLAWMTNVMSLWNTPQLQGQAPNDPVACQELIASGRPNRCVTISGVKSDFPDSDYSGKLDWNAPWSTAVALRYQYSRQIRNSSRIIFGDNYGNQNNRQYNIGATATKIWSGRQTGEFRYGFGNRTTLQDVADQGVFPNFIIPTVRFSATYTLYTAAASDTLPFSGTVIGTSTNVPINRRQHDNQVVYNHTIVFNRHTLRAGVDHRWQLLDDVTLDRNRGYWTFSTLSSISAVRAKTGFSSWENFLRGYVTGFQLGFGATGLAENRFGESNVYVQDDLRLRPNFTLNLGFRWEGVRAPKEIENRFSYGYSRDFDNYEPRIGFAWTPNWQNGWLGRLSGGLGNFVIRGGYGIYHSRLFQSIFSQNQLSIRTQPPNGFAGSFDGLCYNEVSDPSCGFVWTPGYANRTASTPSATRACTVPGTSDNGVRVACGQLIATLLFPDSDLQMPYVQQWNLTLERKIAWKTAIQLAYYGNRGIGYLFYDGLNSAQFPVTSPLVSVDVGGGSFQPVVFDRVCQEASTDPMCPSGSLTSFSSLISTSASLAAKGIVIVSGVPHGYVSYSTMRVNERRPDPTNRRNVAVRNMGWSYYHGMVLKATKQTSHGLSFTASWTWSKAIDTGSEATYTGVDTNAPSGTRNPAASLRGLSSFHAEHRVVVSYAYEVPWMKSQQGWVGRLLGGYTLSGTTTFQSGNPFTVSLGYDANLDGVGGDRPRLTDDYWLYRSVDNGRAPSPCPVTTVPCPNTISELQLPGVVFIPKQVSSTSAVGGGGLFITAGDDGTGTIGRNTFFGHGMNNFDVALAKNTRIRENISLQFRMEFYNLLNRVMFGVPARTVISSTPTGRITSQRNPANFVNSGRQYGARMGQFAIRVIF